jgi:hypothetical protein
LLALNGSSAAQTNPPSVSCQPRWVPTFGLQGGVDSDVSTFAVFDDRTGGGPALYVGGFISNAGGTPVNKIAKWDGFNWSALGSGVSNGQFSTSVYSLCVFDDGSGPALFVGGTFGNAGAAVANDIAKWDGSTWSGLGSGMNGSPAHVVDALAVFDDGSGGGPALFVGGIFSNVPDSGDSYIAKWGLPPGCGTTGTAFCDAGVAGVIACPCANPPSGLGRGCNNSSSTGGASITACGTPSLAADSLVFTALDEKPTATSVVLSGTAPVSAGHVYGQAVRCVGGLLKRLYVYPASGGSIVAPGPNVPSVSLKHAMVSDPITAGTHRYYMVYYRDPTVLGGCPAASTFNGTNALDVIWLP